MSRTGLGMLLLAAMLAGCRPERPASAPEAPLTVYLARHGQTDWNAARRLQGWTDVALNEKGLAQAEELARRLAGVPIDRIYASALRRSRETAEVASRGRIPVEVVPGLNEQKLGKFEGAYLDGRDPEVVAEYERRSADPDDALDSGESRNAHHARVRAAIEEILRRHPTGTLLIVGHGGTNSAVLGSLLGLGVEEAVAIHQANDELYRIDLAPGREPRVWKQVGRDRLAEL